jgi:hypothetical protein
MRASIEWNGTLKKRKRKNEGVNRMEWDPEKA